VVVVVVQMELVGWPGINQNNKDSIRRTLANTCCANFLKLISRRFIIVQHQTKSPQALQPEQQQQQQQQLEQQPQPQPQLEQPQPQQE
jgi:hypothetical protein